MIMAAALAASLLVSPTTCEVKSPPLTPLGSSSASISLEIGLGQADQPSYLPQPTRKIPRPNASSGAQGGFDLDDDATRQFILGVLSTIATLILAVLSFVTTMSPPTSVMSKRLISMALIITSTIALVSGVGVVYLNAKSGTLLASAMQKLDNSGRSVAIALSDAEGRLGTLESAMRNLSCLPPDRAEQLYHLAEVRDLYFRTPHPAGSKWPDQDWINERLRERRVDWRVSVDGQVISSYPAVLGEPLLSGSDARRVARPQQ